MEMKIINYTMVTDCCEEEFANLICDNLEGGWTLYGPHCAVVFKEEGKELIHYSQAMVVYES